ncbi:MAG: DUF6442 family protein [Hominicoprocola sp.]
MNREEILAKSRAEQQDEGLRRAQDIGRRSAWREDYVELMLVLCLALNKRFEELFYF